MSWRRPKGHEMPLFYNVQTPLNLYFLFKMTKVSESSILLEYKKLDPVI